jgi:hypothetical protein
MTRPAHALRDRHDANLDESGGGMVGFRSFMSDIGEDMYNCLRRSAVLPILVCALLNGCHTAERPQAPQWVQVPIAGLSDVAGKWDGLIRVVPHQRRDDWVTVTIAPDGTYEFSSLRTIGVFNGRGEFALNDGKLFSKSERGTIEAALYQSGTQRLLKAKGRAADGTEYTAEVKPGK